MVGAELVSVVALFVVLVTAVVRPSGWPEAVVALPAAALVVAIGAISPTDAKTELTNLAPVVGFLAAILVLARMCANEGLFAWCGAWMAKLADGRPPRLLTAVFVVASVVTSIFSLDATVVLLTPVVLATTARLKVRARPHVYACGHLSNTASLLLPVSNLTNLLAFSASGLTFLRFSVLMALPWLTAIGAEYVVFRLFFRADLRTTAAPQPGVDAPGRPAWFAISTVCATLVAFVVTSAVGINPAWAAAAGALVLAVPALLRRRVGVKGLVDAVDLPFLVFVLALAVVVRAVVDNGLGAALRDYVPHLPQIAHLPHTHYLPEATSLTTLLGVAVLAAVLANLVNNLPAVLVLVPLVAPAGPAAVLATLIGVNIGPNFTYIGSLATMLWRRIARKHDHEVSLRDFTALGLLTTPVALVGAVVALWVALCGAGS